MVAVTSAPIGGLLYSLLHLGGFAGDLKFYSQNIHGHRVLEMGCGDGRVAAALCLGKSPLSVLQQQQEDTDDAEQPTTAATLTSYVGVEYCEPLALKARSRLAEAPCAAEVVVGDFLSPPPPERTSCFDTVVVSANTLFSTPQHEQLLANCLAALAPDGRLLLDVYNSLLWHEEEEGEEGEEMGAEEMEEEEEEDETDSDSPLVRVEDEDGHSWTVYERDPLVDSRAQRIKCVYDFHSFTEAGKLFSESLTHHYLLPEQLVKTLDSCGFAIEELYGGFDEAAFDPEESEHIVVIARRKPPPS
jgi:SAM-dependent methyltransferase